MRKVVPVHMLRCLVCGAKRPDRGDGGLSCNNSCRAITPTTPFVCSYTIPPYSITFAYNKRTKARTDIIARGYWIEK